MPITPTNIKLICSDIDGTLLQYGKKTLEAEILSQIKALSARGILFCPASGRQYTSLRKLFEPVADCCVFLCENGGVLYKNEQCIGKTPMPRALAEEGRDLSDIHCNSLTSESLENVLRKPKIYQVPRSNGQIVWYSV